MNRRTLHTWWRAVLALAVLGSGPVWARGSQGSEQAGAGGRNGQTACAREQVLQFRGTDNTRVEVASTQGFEPGSWVLVHPSDAETSWTWALVSVRSAGEQELELSRPLSRISSGRAELLAVSREEEGSARTWLERPRQGARVPGGALPVEGRAQQGSQVLIFVDGVEGARLEADASGWFAGAVELPATPGPHQLQVVSGTDGVWSLQSESVTVSSLAPPPAPVVLQPANGSATNDTTPLFSGTAQAGTTVVVAIGATDVGSTTVDAAGNWSLSLSSPLANGTYSASVRAQSTSGETSTLVTVGFRVNTTPPNVNIIEDPAARISTTSARIRFMVSGVGTLSVDCIVDGVTTSNCSSPFLLENLSEGSHVVVLLAKDDAGNVDPTPARSEFIVDITPPTVLIRSGPANPSNQRDVTFTLEASEVSRYECFLDTQPVEPSDCAATSKLYFLFEGAHTFSVRATDLTDLVGPEVSYSWTVDLTPPATPELGSPTAGALLRSSTPEISGTAEVGSTVRVLVDDTVVCTATADASRIWKCTPSSPLATNTPSNPTYELVLEAQDAAGNVSSRSAPISFRVDAVLPDTIIVSGPAPALREAQPRFVFQSTEEVEEYECIVDQKLEACGPLLEGSRPFAPGKHSVMVSAIDKAGNKDDSPATWTWTYTLYEGAGGGLLSCSAANGSALFPLGALLVLLRRRRSRSSSREMAGMGGLLAMLVVLGVGSASAQGLDLQRYKPAPGVRDVLGVYSPEVPQNDIGLHLGLSATYGHEPLVLRLAGDGSGVQSIVSNQFTAEFLASVWFSKHFEVGLALPFLTSQGGTVPDNLAVFIPENVTGTGLGDMRLVPKAVKSLNEEWSLGAVGVLSLPTSGKRNFRGSGVVGGQLMALVQWAPLKQLKLLANAGARSQPDTQVALLDLRAGNELTYALGAQWTPFSNGVFFQANVQGAAALNGQANGGRPLEVLLAAGYAPPSGSRLRGSLGGGIGMTDGYGTPKARGLVDIDWSTGEEVCSCTGDPAKDDDQDGLSNGDDVCPYLKGSAGGDGCPGDDSSKRFIGELSEFLKPERDGDGDGFLDAQDACPEEAANKNDEKFKDYKGFKDYKFYNGCAVADSDEDGILDHLDQCYKDPETRNGFAGEDGCPDEVDTVEVQLWFKTGGTTVEKSSLEKLKARLQLLTAQARLEEVSGSIPKEPNWMAARLPSARVYLTSQIQEMLASAKRTETPKVLVDAKGSKSTAAKTDPLTISLTLRIRSGLQYEWKKPEPKCRERGFAAWQLWPRIDVKTGALCDGDVVSASEAGFVLVMADESVLRMAPNSQLTLSKNKGQSQIQQGAAEIPASEAALDAPEVFGPCEKCSPYGSPTLFSWKKVTNAQRYWVQVSRGVGFTSDLRFALTESTESKLNLEAGTWFWRVLPVDSKGLTGKPSKIHSFEVKK
ncbi:Ig-like domain-containing protein [Archangium gephyra]|uniref:Ig-like domain-containing protein n=1 Tax=Archangium gephyra TaxID=48 RepID=A0ABX9K1Y0_9BACT|nr:Ig-like domain-containing protein [Archangium gephyra]